MLKKVLAVAGIILLTVVILIQWKHNAELDVFRTPTREWINLEGILAKEEWNENDYRLVFYQTGLSRRAVETIPLEERLDKLLRAQHVFFTEPTVECTKNSIISWQEQNVNEQLPEIIGIEKGDILVSFCTHTYGWRNGHVGIVIDGEKGRTLEAIVMGEDSCVQSVQKWRNYPAFLVLRLKDASLSEREMIADYTFENMSGIPYGFMTDILEHIIKVDSEIGDTDCSHLIWRSFKEFGYNLDSDGGLIVTPRDIAESPLLEIVQVYGIDLEAIREDK